MMTMKPKTLLPIAAFVIACAPGAFAQHDQHGAAPPDAIGSASVKFQTSCSAVVKDDFNKAVALLHSFWFPEAIKSFESILARDPGCAMAHWGIALSNWGNPFGGLKQGRTIELTKASIEKARTTGSPTPRERGYIQAVGQLVTAGDPGSHAARIGAYETAMEEVSRDNPTDTEARIFYALAVAQTASPADKTYAKNLKAAGILEPLFRQMPTHPGLAHYIIHAYDAPPLAEKALVAARKYASLAPAIPHALHMPSHTFTRLGYHAIAVVGGAEGAAAGAGAFAVAAIPARYALERGAWAEAAALPARPANTPFTEAITHFARAIGAARSGNPAAATADIDRLAALGDKLRDAKDAYWTEQVDIQRRVALAWQTFAGGRKDEAIAQLGAAADAEDATDKSAISPGPLAPARELFGYMLLEAGKPREALAAFEATMKKEPNRFRGLYGGASAAAAAGDRARATAYYKRLLEVAKESDTERPELQQAKKFLGS